MHSPYPPRSSSFESSPFGRMHDTSHKPPPTPSSGGGASASGGGLGTVPATASVPAATTTPSPSACGSGGGAAATATAASPALFSASPALGVGTSSAAYEEDARILGTPADTYRARIAERIARSEVEHAALAAGAANGGFVATGLSSADLGAEGQGVDPWSVLAEANTRQLDRSHILENETWNEIEGLVREPGGGGAVSPWSFV
jgi:hypothetical protein